MDVNVAHARMGAQVLQGEMRTALLDGDTTNYDMERGFTRHPIEEDKNRRVCRWRVVRLGQPERRCLGQSKPIEMNWQPQTRPSFLVLFITTNRSDLAPCLIRPKRYPVEWRSFQVTCDFPQLCNPK